MILDFKARHPGVRNIVEFVKHHHKHSPFYHIQLGDWQDVVEDPVYAEVDAYNLGGPFGWQGRWIALCECGGAEMVDFENLIFMCCGCFNAAHNHRWRRVIPPKDKDKIEEILSKRLGQNRNWKRGESLEKLKAENRKHGIK